MQSVPFAADPSLLRPRLYACACCAGLLISASSLKAAHRDTSHDSIDTISLWLNPDICFCLLQDYACLHPNPPLRNTPGTQTNQLPLRIRAPRGDDSDARWRQASYCYHRAEECD